MVDYMNYKSLLTKKKIIFCLINIFAVISIVIILIFNAEIINEKKIILESKCDCRNEIINIEEYTEDHERTVCDLYNVLRRGKGQKVVSYSLYGSNEIYYKEIKYLSKLVAQYYPGWVIRIHYDKSLNSSIICEFECLKDEKSGKYMDNIDFCNINEIPYGFPNKTWNAQYMHSMKWRFLPIGDPFVDMFMSRDLDSWIIEREVEAVKVWFQSNKLFHVMRGNFFKF